MNADDDRAEALDGESSKRRVCVHAKVGTIIIRLSIHGRSMTDTLMN